MISLQTLITSIFLLIILGSSKKLDLDEEIHLESDMDVEKMDDLDDLDDDELSLDEELPGSQVLQSVLQDLRPVYQDL